MEEKVVFKNICVKSDCLANNVEIPARVYEQAEHLNFLFNCNEWKWILIVFLFLCMFLVVAYACFGDRMCLQAKVDCEQKSCYRVLKRDFIYCGIILVLCAVFIFTITSSNNKDVVSHISFAGTLSSAILSVIAIFMTIRSEEKNSEIKSRIGGLIDKLELVDTKIEDNISNFNNIDIEVKKSFDKFKDLVEQQNKIILKKQDEIFNRVCDLKDETQGNKWKEEKGSISEGIKNE